MALPIRSAEACSLTHELEGQSTPRANAFALLTQTLAAVRGYVAAIVRLLARYVSAEGDVAERCLRQAIDDAAEYAALATELGLSPAAAVEALTVCRAPIVAAVQEWAQATAGDPETLNTLSRVSRCFDAMLLGMVQALERLSAERPRPASSGPVSEQRAVRASTLTCPARS